jgi:hypothetical protein
VVDGAQRHPARAEDRFELALQAVSVQRSLHEQAQRYRKMRRGGDRGALAVRSILLRRVRHNDLEVGEAMTSSREDRSDGHARAAANVASS